MDYRQKIRNYAELIVRHGLNVQAGQLVQLSMEAIHRDFGLLIAEQCYARGAKYVSLDLSDPRINKLRAEKAAEDSLEYIPESEGVLYDEILNTAGATLKIVGSEDPEILTGSNPERVNKMRIGRYKRLQQFYEDGIGKSRVQWCVAAAATPAWGYQVFPNSSPEKACEELWEEIFRVVRVDRPDFLAFWDEHNQKLQARARQLTELMIKELHFEGPGTNLKVGLSERAQFKGGADVHPNGIAFSPNLPTEECFTTPNWKMTQGTARATRPVMINGVLVHDLEMHFEEGELVNFSASAGEDVFQAYISSDEGSRRLGEVALVGIDSPMFASGLTYHEILFDENAACHIAIGNAYKVCLNEHQTLSESELARLGCNESSVHTDIMISSEDVCVSAKSYDGNVKQLIKGGRWTL